MTETLHDLKALAQRWGLSYKTLRSYRSRPGMLPEPDYVLGSSPVWTERTVTRWEKRSLRPALSVEPAYDEEGRVIF